MKPAWLSAGPHLLYRVVLFFAWSFFKFFHRHRVYGLEHYYKGAAIIAANHTSFYDPPIVSVSWPEEVHFLAREGLFTNPLFGGFIRRLNAHPVSGDAGDVAVFKTVLCILSQGKKVILFPEGKRNLHDELDLLKPGIGLLVSRSQSAVIPTYIYGALRAWGRKRRVPKLFCKTACVFGTPILWSDFAHLDKKEAQKQLLCKISDSIQALRNWYAKGAKGSPP